MEEGLNNLNKIIKRGLYAPFFMRFKSNLDRPIVYIVALLIVVLYATIRNYFLPTFEIDSIKNVTQYNNFIIFRNSFYHLLNHFDLYKHYPSEQYDLFKYTPTFALLFGLIALLPKFLGLFLWNLLNAVLPIFALFKLDSGVTKRRNYLFFLILPEILTSILNSQSNGVLIGLVLLGFYHFQKGNNYKFILLITLTIFIKLFTIVALLLLLSRPKQLLKTGFISMISILVLFLLPLLVIGFDELVNQYNNYIYLLRNDHNTFVKLSIFGWLRNWFNIINSDFIIMIIGTVSILAPLIILINKNGQKIQYYFLSLCIWMVIFNHMAESATYIIAVTAIYCYLINEEKIKTFEWIIFALLLCFCELGPSDLYPRLWRQFIVETAQLKFLPCFLFWLIINYKIYFKQNSIR